ncbi:MAG: energy transducer TonB [Desulfobacterales bacterium]|nr:energy transducer TonB [Desulfobacterales bacterium]
MAGAISVTEGGKGLATVPPKPMGKRPRPNWLLCCLIVASMAVHSVIFLHISGLYRSSALTAIELTLKAPERPQVRDIPRPRHRPKHPPPPSRIQAVKAIRRPVPKLQAMKLAPVDTAAPDSLVETLDQPQVPEISAPSLAGWRMDAPVDAARFGNARDYLDMVRLRIESQKKYPVNARARQIEGRVTVRFTIDRTGRATRVEVAGSSRFAMLDEAALKAVRQASPFPRPPGHLFSDAIPLEITILFELT